MNDAATLPPSGRYALLIDALCATIAATSRGGLVPVPWILVIWQRMRRMATRFTKLAEQIRAGVVR